MGCHTRKVGRSRSFHPACGVPTTTRVELCLDLQAYLNETELLESTMSPMSTTSPRQYSIGNTVSAIQYQKEFLRR